MRVAVFRALQLGDLLCALPAIRSIKRNFPRATLSVIGLPHMRELLMRYGFVDEFIAFPGYPGLPEQAPPTPEEIERFAQRMRDRRFDLLFQMQGNGTIVNDLLAGWQAERLVGFCPSASAGDENWMVYPQRLHEVKRHLKLLEHIGLAVAEDDRELLYPLSAADWAAFHRLKEREKLSRYAIVHVGSRDSARRWPLANFKVLAEFLQRRGWQIVLTGAEREKNLLGEMEGMLDAPVVNMAGKTDLGLLGCLVQGAGLLVCNCTGISHVAAALKTKSMVISLDGEPERWGPLNKRLHYTYDGRGELDLGDMKRDMDQLLEASGGFPAVACSSALYRDTNSFPEGAG